LNPVARKMRLEEEEVCFAAAIGRPEPRRGIETPDIEESNLAHECSLRLRLAEVAEVSKEESEKQTQWRDDFCSPLWSPILPNSALSSPIQPKLSKSINRNGMKQM
jgi:hypothetical protein